ncbi:MAG: hypothetical protein GY708_16745 [Actinomycetia bacterium]|nr:hypothetical protein [Actinomycetes bacterium]
MSETNGQVTIQRIRHGLDPEERTLRFDELGPRDDLECRKATGFPVSEFFAGVRSIGSDGVLVLWWAAGRKAGFVESYDRLVDEYPTFTAVANGFEIDNEVEDDSPEG